MKKMMSIILVLAMCFSMTLGVAYAAEDSYAKNGNTAVDASGENENPERSGGSLITFGTTTFTNSGSISLYLSSGNWNADFNAVITGNAGARYLIELEDPDGDVTTYYITSNDGTFTHLNTFIYAKAGTYTFYFTRLTGSASPCTAIAEIRD